MTDALPFPSSDDEAGGAAVLPRPADAEPAEAPPAGKEAPAVPAAPYVGPRAYAPGERLYGRDREAEELMDVLVAERIVLCHSPSGAGKTSLIEALLGPRLDRAGFAVYGPTRVGSALTPGGTAAGANRYVLSALVGMEKQREERLRDSGGTGAEPIPVERLAGMSIAEYLELRSAEDDGRDPVLLFDQFEEILTLDANDVEAKAEFFRQAGAALRPRNRWALFAMREEFVAALDPYVHLVPTRLASRYALQLLDAQGAREAIARPAADAGIPFTAEALDQLVDNLLRAPQPGSPEGVLGRWVEPVQLQVVCTRVWGKLKPEMKEIGVGLVGTIADVETALADYYAETVARVARDTSVGERSVRRWFEKALISGDVRTQVARGGERTHGLNENVVDALVNAYLVRREERRGTIWYELAHDRLVPAVVTNNARWFGGRRQTVVNLAVTGVFSGLLAVVAALVLQNIRQPDPGLRVQEVVDQNDVRFQQEAERTDGRLREVALQAAEEALRADTALRRSEARGDSVQPGVTVWYFPKEADGGLITALRQAGFTVDDKQSRNTVPTNYVFYGDSVTAGTLRLMSYTL
ncbi:MAG TPA: ATP-binding protein, partial [Longimicrobium sp.]|nr:ATP-binding protein [Longimicrobium sp.]